MVKAALLGTCMGTDWRDKLSVMLRTSFFNPVVIGREWTEEDRQTEIRMRKECEYSVYVITPRMAGFYSIAELINDAHVKKEKCIIFVQEKDVNDSGSTIIFTPPMKKSMDAIIELAKEIGATVVDSLEAIAEILNKEEN